MPVTETLRRNATKINDNEMLFTLALKNVHTGKNATNIITMIKNNILVVFISDSGSVLG